MSELIDGILSESGMSGDHTLRGLLGEIERDSIAVRPMPSAELAALLTPNRTAHRRSRRTGTVVITGIVVIGTLALGAGAAAASPGVRSAFGSALGTIVHLVAPDAKVPWLDTNGPAQTGATDTTAPDVDPAPTPDAGVTPAPVSSDPASGDGSNASTTGQANGNGHSDDHGNGNNGDNGHGNKGNGNGNGHSDDHGNGKGNQSGHGNSKGQGNGGPAPTP